MPRSKIYLENYWMLFLEFLDVFGELTYKKIPLPLLANFYQYLDASIQEEMNKPDFKKCLSRKSLSDAEIQPQFERWTNPLKQPLVKRLFNSLKSQPIQGKILLNFDYLRFSPNNYTQYFDPEETVIFAKWEKENYLGIPVHCIKNYATEVHEPVDALIERAKEIFSSVNKHLVFQNQYFNNAFISLIPKMVETIDATKNYFEKNLVSCVVVGTTEDLMSRVLTIVASENGIPSFCMQHGILGGDEAYMPVFATKEAVYGQYEKDWYLKKGISEDHIAITGHPRFDDIFTQRHMKREAFIKKYGLNPQRRYILMATQHICTSLCQRFIEALAKNPTIDIIIKPHPWEFGHGKYIEDYKSLENKYESVKLITERSVNLYDILLNVDVVVINASTVGLEALLCNKPLCILNDFSFEYYDRMGEFKFINPLNLAEFIPDLLQDSKWQEKSKEKSKEFLAYAYPEKLAGNRLIQEINKLTKRNFKILTK